MSTDPPIYELTLSRDAVPIATLTTDRASSVAAFLRHLADEIDPRAFKHVVRRDELHINPRDPFAVRHSDLETK